MSGPAPARAPRRSTPSPPRSPATYPFSNAWRPPRSSRVFGDSCQRSLLLEIAKERSDHDPGPSRGAVGAIAFHERRTGDVEMGPGDPFVDELFEEERRGD